MNDKQLLRKLESLSSKDIDKPVVICGLFYNPSVSGISVNTGIFGGNLDIKTGSKPITGRELMESLRSLNKRDIDRLVTVHSSYLVEISVGSSKITLFEECYEDFFFII